MRVRHCSRCRTDYRPEVVHCADCGGLLEDRDEESDVFGSSAGVANDEPEPAAAADEEFSPVCRARSAYDLVPLADQLAGSGVRFFMDEIQSSDGSSGFQLFVVSHDYTRARNEISEILARGDHAVALESSAEEAEEVTRYGRCPACGIMLSESASSCPECDLPLYEPEIRCKSCGATITGGALRCGHCGAEQEA